MLDLGSIRAGFLFPPTQIYTRDFQYGKKVLLVPFPTLKIMCVDVTNIWKHTVSVTQEKKEKIKLERDRISNDASAALIQFQQDQEQWLNENNRNIGSK